MEDILGMLKELVTPRRVLEISALDCMDMLPVVRMVRSTEVTPLVKVQQYTPLTMEDIPGVSIR